MINVDRTIMAYRVRAVYRNCSIDLSD